MAKNSETGNTGPYLSFRESGRDFIEKFIPGAPDTEPPEFDDFAKTPQPLAHTWVLFEQHTGAGGHREEWKMHKVVEFSTVQDFWQVWNGIPQPSELFDGKKFTRLNSAPGAAQTTIEAFMIFRKGIEPAWEDPANATGGHFMVTVKNSVKQQQVDEYWNNIVLAMVGNSIDECKQITGVRLVDKLSAKAKVTDHIRIELWYNSSSTDAEIQNLRKSMEKIFITRLDPNKMGPEIRQDCIITKKHESHGK